MCQSTATEADCVTILDAGLAAWIPPGPELIEKKTESISITAVLILSVDKKDLIWPATFHTINP